MTRRSGDSLPAGNALPMRYVLGDRYRLDRFLGSGRFGLTYSAIDLETDQKVVVKERVHARMTRKEQAFVVQPFFQDEHAHDVAQAADLAASLQRLAHPGLVPIRAVLRTNNTVYVISEYVAGTRVFDLLRRRGPFERSALRMLMHDVGSGLAHLHDHGYIHHRVQLENIMWHAGRYVLLDYAEPPTVQRKSTWEAVVSPYGAPEQVDPARREGAYTDIYAFGAVLYTCATGELPPSFRARETGQGTLKPLEDAELHRLVQRAMQLDPADRPARVDDWLNTPLQVSQTAAQGIQASSAQELVLRGNAALDAGQPRQAERWYRQAAQHNHAQAQHNLAVLYEVGQGVEQDEAVAARWYEKAAQQGMQEAQNNFGVMLKEGRGVVPDDTAAVRWFRAAAKQGLAAAQANLGVMYEEGRGVAQSDHAAYTWYERAAEQHLPDAQNNLGVLFKEGRGVEQDYEVAVQWYRLAADQGLAKAQHNLGIMYLHGLGIPASDQQALQWFTAAAEQELPEAQHMLGWMYGVGRGVEKSEATALTWFLKAARQGLPEAQQNVGLFYLEGRGVEQDEAEGHRWLEQARAALHPDAASPEDLHPDQPPGDG